LTALCASEIDLHCGATRALGTVSIETAPKGITAVPGQSRVKRGEIRHSEPARDLDRAEIRKHLTV